MHDVFGAFLSFGPCTPARQGFSTSWENSLSGDHLTQDGNPWSLAAMSGPSEKEGGRVGAQIGKLRGSFQVTETFQGPASYRGLPRRPGWWSLYRVLGRALEALCVGELQPPGLVLTAPFHFFGQLEGRTMDPLLGLLWGWIPVSLCLLHILRWDRWPGSY